MPPILWRYESVMELFGWSKSDVFWFLNATDYPGVTGGCVGAVASPMENRLGRWVTAVELQ